MERSITVSLDRRPDLLYEGGELAVGQMRGTSPCSRKPLHAHDGYMLEFVDQGSMWLLEPKTRRSLVGQGQYYLLRPGQEHSQEVDPHIRTLFVGLPKQQVEEVARELTGITKLAFLEPTIALAQREIVTLLEAIAVEVEHSFGGMPIMLQSFGIQLTVQLLRAQHQGEHVAMARRPRMDDRRAFEAIISILRTGIQWNALRRRTGSEFDGARPLSRMGAGWPVQSVVVSRTECI